MLDRGRVLVIDPEDPHVAAWVQAILEMRGLVLVSREDAAQSDVVWLRSGSDNASIITSLRAEGFDGTLLLADRAPPKEPLPPGVVALGYPSKVSVLEDAILEALPENRRSTLPRHHDPVFGFDLTSLFAILTKSECRIAKLIFAAQGAVVSRAKLEAALFDDTPFASEESKAKRLHTHMTSLRKKLSPFGVGIATVQGQGYRLRFTC